tara:strand:- start:1399 stop:1572 length:174 start_codon:yes stop_codon:yes gene_type:complete
MMNALLQKENELQRTIITNLKLQHKSKSETARFYYENKINNLTHKLDDVYSLMESKK